MHGIILQYIYVILIILALVMVARKLKVAYPIVLVIGGLILSVIPGIPLIEINPELIFLIFLPPLLYEAAWMTSWKEFWKWRRVISSFAFLIVIVTSCMVAFVSSSVIPGFTLALGFLLGGIVSPPDAVSATSILKFVKVPKRAVSILEGESLLNDASSLIVFRFALAAVDTGKFVFGEAAMSFFVVIIMGIATGIVIATIYYAIHRWLPTTTNINIVLTLTAPYVMYIVAEQFHVSGVLAVVSGGLFLSSRSHVILDHRSRFQGLNVWSTLAFVLNGLIFILIGLELPLIVQQLDGKVSEAIKYGLIVTAALIIGRLLCTFGASIFTVYASKFIKTADSRPGWRGPIIIGWAGMRGVVSLAAALSIPVYLSSGEPFPQRNMILFITFTVILVTLVFQGLTLPLVIKWVNMPDPDYTMPEKEQEALLQKKLSHAAIHVLDNKYADELKDNMVLQSFKSQLENELRLSDAALEHDLDEINIASADILKEQRRLLHSLNKKAEVREEIVRKYLGLLDLEEERIKLRYDHSESGAE